MIKLEESPFILIEILKNLNLLSPPMASLILTLLALNSPGVMIKKGWQGYGKGLIMALYLKTDLTYFLILKYNILFGLFMIIVLYYSWPILTLSILTHLLGT